MSKPKPQAQTSTNSSEPWKPAQGQLNDILAEAKKQYEASGGLKGDWIDKKYPDMTPEMKQSLADMASSGKLSQVADKVNEISAGAQGNVNNAGGVLGQMASGAGITGEAVNELAGKLYNKEGVDSATGQLKTDVSQALDSQVQGLNQQAGASGNMGSSRAGVAQGVMSGKANEAFAKGSADISNNARNQAQGAALQTLQQNQANKLQAANQQGALGMQQGQLQAGNSQLYQQMLNNQFQGANVGQANAAGQAANDWFNQQGKKGAGWENLSKYFNLVGSIGGMGGTSTATGSGGGGGGGGGAQGALGGAAAGAGAGAAFGPWGAGIGGVLGGLGGMFSDVSMKKNVKRTGKSKTGDSTYKWDWNKSAEKEGMKGKGTGVLAQQVAKDKPDAVHKDSKSGRLMVDYEKVGVKPTGSKPKAKTKGKK